MAGFGVWGLHGDNGKENGNYYIIGGLGSRLGFMGLSRII